MLSPGQIVYGNFTTESAAGLTINADQAPTVQVYHNGVLDAAVVATVTNRATGVYSYQFTVPSDYATGDNLTVFASAIVETKVLGPTVIDSQTIDTFTASIAATLAASPAVSSTASSDYNPANGNISVYRGQDLDIQQTATTASASIAGWAFQWQMSSDAGGVNPILTKTPTIISASSKTVNIPLVSADTKDLSPAFYWWSLWRTDTGSRELVGRGVVILSETALDFS